LPNTGRAIGIDVGVRHFLTDSEGRQVENPRFYERTLERIKRRQRTLSRKKKGSRNREKARVRLAKAYEKLVNQRDDFLHKLSRFYVDNYDLIAVERLNISGMARNHRLGGKIDASWGKFLRMLSYKAERAGRRVVEVDPRGTSQNLPEGFDRGYVAACRILSLGLGRPRSYACGDGAPTLRPGTSRGRWASPVGEAGSPHPLGVGSSQTCALQGGDLICTRVHRRGGSCSLGNSVGGKGRRWFYRRLEKLLGELRGIWIRIGGSVYFVQERYSGPVVELLKRFEGRVSGGSS
jgi:IS605 OrfB family transposase